MPDLSAEIVPPQPTRLADYRPPAFLVDTVDLTFDLGESETRVRSRLAVRRNPETADAAAPLTLDGDELTLLSVALDGEALGANRWRQTAEGGLVIDDVPAAFTLDIETRIDPHANS